jgi:hypothetical protein
MLHKPCIVSAYHASSSFEVPSVIYVAHKTSSAVCWFTAYNCICACSMTGKLTILANNRMLAMISTSMYHHQHVGKLESAMSVSSAPASLSACFILNDCHMHSLHTHTDGNNTCMPFHWKDVFVFTPFCLHWHTTIICVCKHTTSQVWLHSLPQHTRTSP